MNAGKSRRDAIIISALVLFGSVLAFATWQSTVSAAVPKWQYLLSGGVALGSLLLLLAARRLSAKASTVVLLLNVIVTLLADTIINLALARSSARFEPFIGNKEVAFAIAIIAPVSMPMNYAVLAACALLPLLDYFFLIPAQYRRNIMSPEPWTSIMYAVIAVAILRGRVKELEAERAAARALKEKEDAEELARKFLALRDMANTPLQTIAFACALLKKNPSVAETLVAALQGSYDNLKELSEILSAYEAAVHFGFEQISFDPRAVLKTRREWWEQQGSNL
jgi:hypothetical protein